MRRVLCSIPAGTVIVALAVAACSRGDSPDSKGQITMKGTVHQVTQPDGQQCWQFQSAKGNNYELQPAQVPHDLLVDGEQATIVAKKRQGGTFCKNVGTLVDVISTAPQNGA